MAALRQCNHRILRLVKFSKVGKKEAAAAAMDVSSTKLVYMRLPFVRVRRMDSNFSCCADIGKNGRRYKKSFPRFVRAVLSIRLCLPLLPACPTVHLNIRLFIRQPRTQSYPRMFPSFFELFAMTMFSFFLRRR